jgi:hypothetical protein
VGVNLDVSWWVNLGVHQSVSCVRLGVIESYWVEVGVHLGVNVNLWVPLTWFGWQCKSELWMACHGCKGAVR